MANKLVTDLSGGMNTRSSPLKIADNECELILNYKLDDTFALTKRPGYDVFSSQPVSDTSVVLGLFQAEKQNTVANSNPVMVMTNSGDTKSEIFEDVSGTWTSRNTANTKDLKHRFAEFIDYTFTVNGTDVVLTSTDLVTWANVNAPTVILPRYIAVFQDRVYVARGSATGQKSRFWFSDLPDATAQTIAWDTTNSFVDVNPDDGDEITALENNGNKLLIFKNRAMYTWIFGQVEPDRIIGVGTESQECVKTNLDIGITFFANARGAYMYDGGRPRLISRKIQTWFDAVGNASGNQPSDFSAETDQDNYYLYLSDSLTVGGRTYTNVMAVYNIPLDAWTIWTLHAPVRVMAKLIQSGAEGIYFGSTNGRTYQLLQGTADDSGGASESTATPIAGEIVTKEYLLTFPEDTIVQEVNTIATEHVAANAQYRMDRSDRFTTLGGITERFKKFSIKKPNKGKSIQLKITDNSENTSRIEGWDIRHNPVEDTRATKKI